MNFLASLVSDPSKNRGLPTVVLSRVPPDMKDLAAQHEALARALSEAGIAFQEIDSPYDLPLNDPQIGELRAIGGDLVFLGWHYPRAVKWILARHDLEVNGRSRKLHPLDARERKPEQTAAQVKEILAGKASAEIVSPGAPPPKPAPDGLTPQQRGEIGERELAPPENAKDSPRWYPVIDYDKCTNCMDCLDFCLFGVYGVDFEGILRTTQQDQCRQDCPACARVCPVGAIVFPKYPTNPTIAGADDGGDRGSVKLDLSAIFGKPKGRHQAALERNRELIKAGRTPVGMEKMQKLADEFDQADL